MGMDAKATVWVGLRSEDCDVDEIIEKLPDELFDEYGYALWEDEKIEAAIAKYGTLPVTIRCSEEYAGIGVPVFSHDWDCGAAEFDPIEIQNRILDERPKLQQLFDSCGILNEIKVWCQTDWS